MSWDLMGDIYTRKKDGEWVCREHSMLFNGLKRLAEPRDNLDWEDYASARISEDDTKELEARTHVYDYDSYNFICSLKKEVADEIDVAERCAEHEGRLVHIVAEEDADKISGKAVPSEEILRMSSEERNTLLDFYYIKKEERGYGDGRFFDIDSFAPQRDRLQRELRELYLKKDRYDRLKESLEYLKLSEEEKENVDNSYPYDYLDEQISETEHKLDSLISIIGILDYYKDWEEDFAVLYLYSC